MGAPRFILIEAWTDGAIAVYREREEHIGTISAAAKTSAALTLVRQARKLLREAGAKKSAERVAGIVHSVEGAARNAELRERTKKPAP